MYDQTSINGRTNGQPASRPTTNPSVIANVADVLHDATELAELQMKLFASDAKATLRKSAVSLLVLVAASSLVLGAIPVGLLALAETFARGLHWSRPLALLASAACGLLLAVAIGTIGARGFKNSLTELNNSKSEFRRNLKWMKRTLKRGGSSGRAN